MERGKREERNLREEYGERRGARDRNKKYRG